MSSPYLTIREVAQIERIHIETVRERARAGKIPGATRQGRLWRINTTLYAKHRGLTLDQIAEAVAPAG